MTEERRLQLEEKLNEAEATGDSAKITAVKKTMEQEYRVCTSHTAERLKRVEATVNQIKDGLIPANMFDDMKQGLEQLSVTVTSIKTEMDGWKNQMKGAKSLWTLLRYLVAAGGGGLLIKFLSAYQP